MNVLVAAGLSDYKIKTTIAPIAHCKSVEKLYLIRRRPFNGEKIICYSPPSWMRGSSLFSEIYRLLAIFYVCLFKKVDILVGIHFYFHSVFVALVGGIFRKPYVISIVEEPQLYKKHKLFSFIVKRALSIGVRGSRSKEFLEKDLGLKAEKVFVLPDYFQGEESSSVGDKLYDILFLGEFTGPKRLDILIEVFVKLKERGLHFKGAIVGDGPLRNEVKKNFQSKGLSSHVAMRGYVKDPLAVLRQAKVLIMTSDTEGMPTVLIEAMSCGLPLIVSDVGDIVDYAKHENNALVYKALDVEQCADYCEKVLSNESLYDQLVENTKNLWMEKKPKLSIENVSYVWSSLLKKREK